MPVKISVAMATFNGERYLSDQLDSFVRQSRLPDELVISDDCSTDATRDIIDRFASIAPFKVRLLSNDVRLGYAHNFGRALASAEGDWVFLSDQDDVWLPAKIERVLTRAVDSPHALVVMNDAELTDAELVSVGLTKLGQIRAAGLNDLSFVMGCCCAVHRSLLDLCLPVPEGYASHDGWIVSIADALGSREIVDESLQFYRRHPRNESDFIVNRTVRVTRYAVLRSWVSRRSIAVRGARFQKELQQLDCYIEGLAAVIRRADARSKTELSVHLKRMRAYQELSRTRFEVRNRAFWPRAITALMLYVTGRYRVASGFKSCIRDIIG